MGAKATKLSSFQREKLLHEFKVFYDIDGDGVVTWGDFEKAKEKAMKLNGWKKGSDKERSCEDLFQAVWSSLQQFGDKNKDGEISADEWLKMWEDLFKEIYDGTKLYNDTENLPFWLYRYLQYRFRLYDRTGDGVLDSDEFEYVLSDFKVSPPECRKAWLLFTKNNEIPVDFKYFTQLACEYYFSDHPGALGNFITGRIDFTLAESNLSDD